MAQEKRVNIQYSVRLEEVPELALTLFNEAVESLIENMEDLPELAKSVREQTLRYENYSHGLEAIETIRQVLAEADYRLQDVWNMLGGLRKIQAAEAAPQPPESRVDELNRATEATRQMAQAMAVQNATNEHAAQIQSKESEQ